ncbi:MULTISPECIES: methyltransferase domain-containing protein [unclassified Shewanella]|uniref:class I SAM-dependent methyltransferase n=1 Tax=unclassified Shewanella TaxID=196818 RepID=UPI000C8282FD|nr:MULTISPECIES: methyltransferase domain-containing protein [unclassified Shewanella]MDO6619599.1 methyltransferase domain-containing protein [Shewanella sp. 6_MG-2023]MDO6641914.1 methyltransferase domain-containing protein [Shewanella sp. 5_MG-2023]MDO6680253.1 methyltransferase domain-containing protein [Shewanella sp. 4_MG-2023]MDO6775894.1 methyltransferase domain-containing protein [Shewanella sp. 3_MG-2023]PMG29754.1 histidine kinase [Shewanella sp. 10N.286.52.C2]
MTTPVRVRYHTIEIGDNDIHLCTLRDKQQFSDDNNTAKDLGISSALWPIFGVVWPSSMVLANHMLDYQTQGKRILEIGCGIGLSSLLLNQRADDITATDYHPEVEGFLLRNTQLNNDKSINFERVDWADDNSDLGQFDLIIGSDLLYEDEHIALLAYFIQAHAKRQCEIVIVDPGRGRKNKLTTKMDEYGFSHNHIKPIHTDYLTQQFKGHILRFSRES